MSTEPERPIESALNNADLATLREFIATTQVLSHAIGNVIQVRVVLDTNMILRDVIYLSERRHKAGIRTSIQELIISQTLIPYAPSVAKYEVEKSLPEIARKRRMSAEVLQGVWAEYAKSLNFCEVATETTEDKKNVRDPKDLPFIQLAKEIRAGGIATDDKDIPAMGGTGIQLDCIIQLRDYARAKHIELAIRLGGTLLIAASIGALIGLIKILIQLVGRSPAWIKLALLGTAVFVIAHPKSREFIAGKLKVFGSSVKNGLEEPFSEVLTKYSEAQKNASATLSKTLEVIEVSVRTPLSVHVYATCLASKNPLSPAEIERKVFTAGYKTRSKDFQKYLLRVLKQDTRLQRTHDGKWCIAKASPA